MSSFSVPELIRAKRDGATLSPEQLRWIVESYTADTIPDYQMSAMLMAILFNGLNREELAAWTAAMLHSGDVLDLSAVAASKVDKHSTGGVGDKISIPLVPLVAACGIAVPMISGRGLGHTGGTLDKLESIPGFTTTIPPSAFPAQLNAIGLVFAGQTETLVPADRKIYALRDATGTVPSLPLISSSIMSKKLAEDIAGLVLDVKVGHGAFMKTVEDARALAETMAGIGDANGTPVVAVLTNMDQPLGTEVGNANEIMESIATLRGEGPSDVTALTVRFGGEMLFLGGAASTVPAGEEAIVAAIESGAGLERFAAVIAAQGGDPRVIEDHSLLPSPTYSHTVTASASGVVAACNALDVGRAAVRLGAGRARKEDEVDPAVGITLHAKMGDEVAAGEPLATVGYNDENRLAAALELLEGAWTIDRMARPKELIIETIPGREDPHAGRVPPAAGG